MFLPGGAKNMLARSEIRFGAALCEPNLRSASSPLGVVGDSELFGENYLTSSVRGALFWFLLVGLPWLVSHLWTSKTVPFFGGLKLFVFLLHVILVGGK